MPYLKAHLLGMWPQPGRSATISPSSGPSFSFSDFRALCMLSSTVKSPSFCRKSTPYHRVGGDENCQRLQLMGTPAHVVPSPFLCCPSLYIHLSLPAACLAGSKNQHKIQRQQPYRYCLTGSHNCAKSDP